MERLIEGILADHGRLDVLVNTVGGYVGGMKLWESDTATLDRMLALNLRSGFVLSRAAAKAMLRQGKGAIVNVAAKAALDHEAGLGAYAASKAAAVAMMDSLAADLKGTAVRVELDPAQHHRYGNQSEGDAQRGLRDVAEARGDRARHPVPVQRRCQSHSRSSHTRVRKLAEERAALVRRSDPRAPWLI